MLPTNVRLFEQLMYISLVIGIILAAIQDTELPANMMAHSALVFFVQIFIFVLLALLIWLIARRRKSWGRWVLLVLWVVGIVPFAIGLTSIFAKDVLFGVTQIIQAILQLVALYFIFTGDAKPWFRRA